MNTPSRLIVFSICLGLLLIFVVLKHPQDSISKIDSSPLTRSESKAQGTTTAAHQDLGDPPWELIDIDYWPSDAIIEEKKSFDARLNLVHVDRLIIEDPALGLILETKTYRKDASNEAHTLIEHSETSADSVLVLLATSSSVNQLDDLVSKEIVYQVEKLTREGLFRVHFSEIDSIEKALEARTRLTPYILSGLFEYVELDHLVRTSIDPNDEHYQTGELWGLHNTGQNGGTPDIDIDAPEGWDIRTSAEGVVVAVLDTGINYNHEDLRDNIWINPGEIPGNGIDDDDNGYVDDVHGVDILNNDGDPMDDHFHGTHAAGTIGAVGGNNVGITGVCWTTKLMACKFLSSNGQGWVSDAIQSIDYAIANGASVINNSWGGGPYSRSLKDALRRANDAGVIAVSAAGNNSRNTDTYPVFPAFYSLPNIISVAAINSDGLGSSFSNYGPYSVDIAAPGEDILSTDVTNNGYRVLSGTSMAAPHVTGVVALTMAEYPELDTPDIIRRVTQSGQPIDELEGFLRHPTCVNLFNALSEETIEDLPIFIEAPDQQIQTYAGETLRIQVETDSNSPVTYSWQLDGNTIEGEETSELSTTLVNLLDQGFYTVTATNEMGASSASFWIKLIPKIPDSLVHSMTGELNSFYANDLLTWVDEYPFDSTDGKSSFVLFPNRFAGLWDSVTTNVMGPGVISFDWRKHSNEERTLVYFDAGENEFWTPGNDWSSILANLPEQRNYPITWTVAKENHEGGVLIDNLKFTPDDSNYISILNHPESVYAKEGDSVWFEVSASGPDLNYQWYYDLEVPVGGNSSKLVLQSVRLEDSGSYHVEISNGDTVVRSLNAKLEVGNTPAQIIGRHQPIADGFPLNDVNMPLGAHFVLDVEVVGNEPIEYSWYKDGVLLEGANTNRLVFDPITSANSGDYRLLVENEYNEEPVTVRFGVNDRQWSDYHFSMPPHSEQTIVGDPVSIFASAEGELPLSYQWYRRGTRLPDQTDKTLNFDVMTRELEDEYLVLAQGPQGLLFSELVQLKAVSRIGEALEQPGLTWKTSGSFLFQVQAEDTYDGEDALISALLGEGTPGIVSTQVTGPTVMSFWWKTDLWYLPITLYLDSSKLVSCPATTSWTQQHVFIPEGIHDIWWEVSDENSGLDYIQFSNEPGFFQLPEPIAEFPGRSIVLKTQAVGINELNYQWFFNGQALEGETGSTLVIEELQASDAGSYTVRAITETRSIVSDPVKVTAADVLSKILPGASFVESFSIDDVWRILDPENGEEGYTLYTPDNARNLQNSFEITVEGPGYITFEHKKPSNQGSDLVVLLDGTTPLPIGPRNYWTSDVLLIPEGVHTVTWNYTPFGQAEDESHGFGYYLKNLRFTKNPVVTKVQRWGARKTDSWLSIAAWTKVLEPSTQEWFKDDLKLEGASGPEYFFTDISENTEGLYKTVITDAYGNSTSEEFPIIVSENILEAIEVKTLGTVNDYSWSANIPGNNYWRSQKEDTWDGEDALWTGNETGLAHLQIFLSDVENSFRFRWKSTNEQAFPDQFIKFDAHVEEVETGEDFFITRYLKGTGEWETIDLLINEPSEVHLRFDVIQDSENYSPSGLWLDAFEVIAEDTIAITRQPQSIAATLGQSINLTIETKSNASVGYQWRKEGIPIPGATSQNYTIDFLMPEHVGEYDVVVSNSTTQIQSGIARIDLYEDPGGAIDVPGLALTSYGPQTWFISDEQSFTGDYAFSSPDLAPDESSTLSFKFNGTGEFSFFYKHTPEFNKWKDPSTEARLEFLIDGQGYESAEIYEGWNRVKARITDEEEHIVTITYSSPGELIINPYSTTPRFFVDAFVLPNVGAANFDKWSEKQGLISDPEYDADHDGIPLFAEYAFGLNPQIHDFLPHILPYRNGDNLGNEITFTRLLNAGDLFYLFESSENLETWNTWPLTHKQVVPLGNGLERVTFQTLVYPSPSKRQFYRLRAFPKSSWFEQ